jgi:hypothetical protein
VIFLNCDLTGEEFIASKAKNCDLQGSKLDDMKGFMRLPGALTSVEQALSIAAQLATESGLHVAG